MSTNRATQVNFSAPYNYTDLSLAANRKLAGSFKELSEFNKSTVTIGVLDTSTAVDIASNAFPNAQLKTYAEDSDPFNDLLEDKIYAAVADSPRPQIVAKLFPEKVDVPSPKAIATFPASFAKARRHGFHQLSEFVDRGTHSQQVAQKTPKFLVCFDGLGGQPLISGF